MQYYGTVLDLYKFHGHVYLKNNVFSNNVLQYESCDLANEMALSNKANYIDRFPTFGTKNKL